MYEEKDFNDVRAALSRALDNSFDSKVFERIAKLPDAMHKATKEQDGYKMAHIAKEFERLSRKASDELMLWDEAIYLMNALSNKD